jgi:hypothetical protein
MPRDIASFRKIPTTLLNEELVQEKATALGRLGRRLEAAIEALAAFDAMHPANVSPPDRSRRTALVAEAGYALWLLVAQREACGLRDSRAVLTDYKVPREVQVRAGTLPPDRPMSRRRR